MFETRALMGRQSAADFAIAARDLLKTKDIVRVIFAAAPSQNDFLKAITQDEDIDFSRIDAFHMDEYVGLKKDDPHRFANFLQAKLFSLRRFHCVQYIDPDENNLQKSCDEYARRLNEKPIDIVCMGIGENGHIAFNEPSYAKFNDPEDMKVVKLDDICRMQQVHDGCFPSIDKVPARAVTVTIPMLMSAKYNFCMVPGTSKAKAVKRMLEGPVDESFPCTILREKSLSILYLDKESSSLI